MAEVRPCEDRCAAGRSRAGTGEQALTLARERGTGVQLEPFALVTLAEAHLARGDLARTRATAERALEAARRRGTVVIEPEALIVLARVLLRTEGAGARQAIEAALRRALAVAGEIGAKIHEPSAHIALAELARLRGDHETRARELGEACRLFTELGAVKRAEQVALDLAGDRPSSPPSV